MVKLFAFGLVLVLLLSGIFAVMPASAQTYPSTSIKIYRIMKIDDIEGSGEGEADWFYHVGIYKDGSWEWQHSPVPIATDQDNVIVNKVHKFTVSSTSVRFNIKLCEDDYWSGDDKADIGSDSSGGLDDGDCVGYYVKGKGNYDGTYNLKTNTLTGDKTTFEQGYYKTSGDYDGSIATDQNDAAVYFSISDDYDPPTANAGYDQTVYVGDLVNFNGYCSSASAGSSISKYEWDFNNDGIYDAEGQIVSHTYNKKGTYTVVLRATDSLGVTDTDSLIVTVPNPPPTASFKFSPSNPTTATNIQFTDTSTDGGVIIAWHWNFGDYSSSSEQNPTHKYSDDGTYTVRLTVTDNDNARDSISKTVTVQNVPPAASFSVSPSRPTTDDTITFLDKSTDSDGKVVSRSWDFGDGYSSSQKQPTHKYTSAGTYTVKLTVTDDDGATDSTTKAITIKKPSLLPPISERATSTSTPEEEDVPGFEVVFAIAGLLTMVYLLRRRK